MSQLCLFDPTVISDVWIRGVNLSFAKANASSMSIDELQFRASLAQKLKAFDLAELWISEIQQREINPTTTE